MFSCKMRAGIFEGRWRNGLIFLFFPLLKDLQESEGFVLARTEQRCHYSRTKISIWQLQNKMRVYSSSVLVQVFTQPLLLLKMRKRRVSASTEIHGGFAPYQNLI